MRIAMLANPRSGRLAREDEALLDALSAHGSIHAIEQLDGDTAQAVSAIIARKPDAIAIAGGNGTIRAVTEAAVRANCTLPLIPLPLGTANRLPRALYGDRDAMAILDGAGRFSAGQVWELARGR
ncbi:diacylglycerol kinase family protein [Maricaulis sp.]|uniref:diacylglycerol kinase family protein n=1 Tax=Maricaulis sp. TaxID=1486257 RepID=UPI0025BB0431|nr:diacylglycerol kinase family protein [Maricaulis sp.]